MVIQNERIEDIHEKKKKKKKRKDSSGVHHAHNGQGVDKDKDCTAF
jgi:hypothetical protein